MSRVPAAVALTALAALSALSLTRQLALVADLSPTTGPATGGPTREASPVKPLDAYLDAILGRNLFGTERAATRSPHPPRLGIRMHGSVVADEASASVALLSSDGERPRHLAHGDAIRGAIVERIEPRAVVLRFEDGERQTLTLGTERAPTSAEPDPSRTERVVARAEVDALLDRPQDLVRQARVSPFTTADGLFGQRLTGIRRGSLLDRIGLANGDVVLGVQGIAPGDVSGLLDLLGDLRTTDAVSVTVLRRGARQTVRVRIE
jgi:type II secretion system protein C